MFYKLQWDFINESSFIPDTTSSTSSSKIVSSISSGRVCFFQINKLFSPPFFPRELILIMGSPTFKDFFLPCNNTSIHVLDSSHLFSLFTSERLTSVPKHSYVFQAAILQLLPEIIPGLLPFSYINLPEAQSFIFKYSFQASLFLTIFWTSFH